MIEQLNLKLFQKYISHFLFQRVPLSPTVFLSKVTVVERNISMPYLFLPPNQVIVYSFP